LSIALQKIELRVGRGDDRVVVIVGEGGGEGRRDEGGEGGIN